jgi:hypothetical protein
MVFGSWDGRGRWLVLLFLLPLVLPQGSQARALAGAVPFGAALLDPWSSGMLSRGVRSHLLLACTFSRA